MTAKDRPVAIVTGAGTGIGRATALRLSGLGWRVTLIGRRRDLLEQTAQACPGETWVRAQDLNELADVPSLVDETVARWERLDALVHNAATLALRPIPDLDAAHLLDTLRVNMVAAALLTARAWPVFVSQGGGSVVHISSLSTTAAFSGGSAYVASKAALEGLAHTAHLEGRGLGIRVFVIAPGPVETAMLRSLISRAQLPEPMTFSPDQVAAQIERCLLGACDDMAGRPIELDPDILIHPRGRT